MTNKTIGENLLSLSQTSQAMQSDLDSLLEAVSGQRARLKKQILGAERESLFAQFDQAALQDFLDHPYLLQKTSGEQWRLIVPRFYGFSGGWLERHEGNYSIYIVSRFANMLNPVPGWLANELGFADPEFKAYVKENILTITEGDPSKIYHKLGGEKRITRRDGNKLYLKPASRFEVLRRIIGEEGILPFMPMPVAPEDLRTPLISKDDKGHPTFTLRPHQLATYDQFLKLGSVLLLPKPQTGKSYLVLQALASIKGPKLILAPSNQLLHQWQRRVEFYLLPEAGREIVYTTYQSAHKFLKHDWTLIVPDESHSVPANRAMEAIASAHTKYRIGPSSTPFREDGRHELMPLLCGFPIGTDWPLTDYQKPRVIVWLSPNQAAKIAQAVSLAKQPIKGKTLIYVQRIAVGETLAQKLKAPFFHGTNQKHFDTIGKYETAIVSSIADEGLSLEVKRIIEVDFLFGSRRQAGQRLGRLMNVAEGQTESGEHHLMMTEEEYKSYGKRLLAYESWQLDIDIRTGK